MVAFKRYDGADEAGTTVKMPRDELDAATSRLSLGEMLGHYEAFCNEPDHGADRYPWAKGFAMGFPLPSFQRDPSWDIDQKVRFILSIWSGVDLGTYLVNDVCGFIEEEGKVTSYREFTGALLDGQQRLTAIEQYVTNQFPIPDAEGIPRYWRELGRIERRRFAAITFTQATISTWDEGLLRKAYDLRAFGGTAHKEDERASKPLL